MKLKLLLFLLLLAGFARAQQDVGGFLHLSAGISFPNGDFSSKDGNNSSAGFAKNGLTINALFGHKIHKQWGGFAMFTLAAHSIDASALSEALNQNASSYFWKADKGYWTVTGFTFGPQFSQNFKKSAIDFRIGAGALNFISPELVIHGVSLSGGPSAKYTRKKQKSSSFVIGGGLTYKYEVKWGWVILANMDYYMAKPTFTGVEEVTEIDGQNPQINYTTFQQEFIMFQSGLGVGYVF